MKGHLPDTDEVMGGTGENGDKWKGDRLDPNGEQDDERWQSRHLGKWQVEGQSVGANQHEQQCREE